MVGVLVARDDEAYTAPMSKNSTHCTVTASSVHVLAGMRQRLCDAAQSGLESPSALIPEVHIVCSHFPVVGSMFRAHEEIMTYL